MSGFTPTFAESNPLSLEIETMTTQSTINGSLHPIAKAAATAARNWKTWGAFAARRYAERRGVSSHILTLARVLACAEAAGIHG